MDSFSSLSICATDNDQRDIALSLAQRLEAPILESCNDACDLPYILAVTKHPTYEYQWELRFPAENLSPITPPKKV